MSDQKSDGEKAAGTTTEPPEQRGARRPQRRPWSWNSGITSIERSLSDMLYVVFMFPGRGGQTRSSIIEYVDF